MTIVRYLLRCLVVFFDAWVGNGRDASWLDIGVATVLIFAAFAMYFTLYWKVISPKCYRLWMCTILTFLVCVAIWGAFILLCIGGEWIIRSVF